MNKAAKAPTLFPLLREDAMQKTVKLIQNIEKIFERGLQDEYLSRAIRKIVEHTKERTSTDNVQESY